MRIGQNQVLIQVVGGVDGYYGKNLILMMLTKK
jgi:hypothetical protein